MDYRPQGIPRQFRKLNTHTEKHFIHSGCRGLGSIPDAERRGVMVAHVEPFFDFGDYKTHKNKVYINLGSIPKNRLADCGSNYNLIDFGGNMKTKLNYIKKIDEDEGIFLIFNQKIDTNHIKISKEELKIIKNIGA